MTDRLDRLLRETVQNLAVDSDVISDRDRGRLAMHAIDYAHTLRARRRGAIAAALVLVIGLAVGAPYGLRYLGSWLHPAPTVALPAGVSEIPGVPTHVIADTSKPIELVDGWYVAGNQLVLNPSTRSYQSFGNPTAVMLSPNGRWIATSSSYNGYRVYDLEHGGDTRYEATVVAGVPVTIFYGNGQWSPDGDRLLMSVTAEDNVGVLIDVTTQTETYAVIGSTPGPCLTCELIWLPSGTELAMALRGADNADALVAGLQTFSLDGTPGALLPIHGIPAGVGAWSPDGRHVIVTWAGRDGSEAQIVDATTGAVTGSLDRVNVAQAQWIDNRKFLTWEPIITEEADARRAIVSLRTIDGDLLERWIPPTEIVRIDGGPTYPPLAIHLG